METRNIEKLLTDLKNLPKQNAPEDFEDKLLQRISNYEMKQSSGELSFKNFFKVIYNPIYLPAFTIVIVALMIVYTIEKNKLNLQSQISLEKAVPVVQENSTQVLEPQKISVPKKREYVLKRDKIKLNLGPGISLDEEEYSYNPAQSKQEIVDFPFPNEPVTIRIPPPEIIFRKEFDRLEMPNQNKDSIRLTNNRRR